MRTEISTKFTRERLEEIYADAGLELADWWTDPDELYAPARLARAAPTSSRAPSASISSPTLSGVVIGSQDRAG